MYASSKLADLWEILYRDCTVRPMEPMDHDCARFVLTRHAGHRNGGKPYLAALARVSAVLPGGLS